MKSSGSILPQKPIQTKPLPGRIQDVESIQDLNLEYVADDIAESKSIYTAKNRSTLFESGTTEKPHDKLVSDVAFHNLLRHVVCGEQTKAQKIIKAHPEFLFKSGRVNDLSGNTFVSFCPVESARYAHDAEMLAMMKPYADKLKDGAEKFTAILRNAAEYEEAKKHEVYDFNRIITAFAGTNEDLVTDELNKIRQTFGPRVIENTEKSYNTENLRKAYDLYEQHFDGWSADRHSLFWCEVIGYLQRSLPACFAQFFCQSLYDGVNQTLYRGLVLLGGRSFYPSDLSVSRGLGFDYAIYFTEDGVARIRGERCERHRDLYRPGLKFYGDSLCPAKKEALQELMLRPSDQAKEGCCLIM